MKTIQAAIWLYLAAPSETQVKILKLVAADCTVHTSGPRDEIIRICIFNRFQLHNYTH